MEIIPLQSIPNQELSIKLNGNNYSITIKNINNTDDAENNLMAVSISRNNELLISGFRLVSGFTVIPYRYLEDGNFAFSTPDQNYPDYTRFGVTQFMFYADPEELESIRADT